MADVAAFVPTHTAPADGLKTWTAAGDGQPGPDIPPNLEVRLLGRQGDWAHVACSNGWKTWVDGRQLVDLEAARAKATALVGALDAAVKAYAAVVDDASAQRIDEAEFKRRALEAGTVRVDGELWLLDLPNTRWYRYDGFSVQPTDIGKA